MKNCLMCLFYIFGNLIWLCHKCTNVVNYHVVGTFVGNILIIVESCSDYDFVLNIFNDLHIQVEGGIRIDLLQRDVIGHME